MDCNECKEKMLLYLDADTVETIHELTLQDFENHIKSCASCAKEVKELKESLSLVKDKEVFIPEFTASLQTASSQTVSLQTASSQTASSQTASSQTASSQTVSEKIERTEIEMPQVIKNAVRAEYPVCHMPKRREWFMVMQKEHKIRFALPPLKFAYAMAIILCVGLGIYLITFMANNYALAPKTKVAVKTPVISEEKHAESLPVLPKKEDKDLLAANKTKEKTPDAITPAPAKTAAKTPGRKEKDVLSAQKEVISEKAAIPAPQDKAASGVNIEMMQKTPMAEYKTAKIEADLDNKQSITAKNAYAPPDSEPVYAEINEKLKKIVSEYKDVTFAVKKEGEDITIYLTCPKDMKKETIEELKTKIFNQIKIDKDKIVVTIKK